MDLHLKSREYGLRLFLLGSSCYPLLELAWRGHTHWSMALAGGCAALLLGGIARRRCTFAYKCVLGALAITCVEFSFGLLFNVLGGLQVWDYSAQPFNIMGQICLPFCLLWLLLSALVMPFLCRAAS
ncbi:MAG: hypothetical protein IJC70_07245 [Firmicutes bacterium]|nr:hypothetical protein [Bacillota bacterium]